MAFNFEKFNDRLSELGFLPGDVQVTANPSEDFIRAKTAEVFNDPEVTNIKTNAYTFKTPSHQPSQGTSTSNVGSRTDEHSTGRTFTHDVTKTPSPASDDPVAKLKEEANIKIKAREYSQANELYTKALAGATSSTPPETKRSILSNRSQSYLLLGDVHTALRDTNIALSDEFTKPSSPKWVTLRLHYRRAKIYSHMARYEEAQAEFDVFEKFRGGYLTPEEKKFKEDIKGTLAGTDKETREKHALIRAVDSRGLILPIASRSNFPFPPGSQPSPDDYKPDGKYMSFDTTSGPRTNDSLISIPIHIIAPQFIHSPYGGQFHAWTRAVSESDAIGTAFKGMFESYASAQPSDFVYGFAENCRSSALHHEDSRNTVVLVTTHRGRILVVPPDTSIKDLIAGAQWPRVHGSKEFNDERKVKRRHEFEFDGIELQDGWYIDVYVIPKKCLDSHLNKLEADMVNLR